MIIEAFWVALPKDMDGPALYLSDPTTLPSMWRLLNYNAIVAFADALVVCRNILQLAGLA
jgi:hypothetical protein